MCIDISRSQQEPPPLAPPVIVGPPPTTPTTPVCKHPNKTIAIATTWLNQRQCNRELDCKHYTESIQIDLAGCDSSDETVPCFGVVLFYQIPNCRKDNPPCENSGYNADYLAAFVEFQCLEKKLYYCCASEIGEECTGPSPSPSITATPSPSPSPCTESPPPFTSVLG